MVVQHNISAMNANRYYGINNSGLSKSLEKLSSGFKINRAGDDAAGLAVSEKMRSQIGGLTQGVKNAQDGISMIQTYEGALTETDSILQRMKTLADQAANGTYQDDVDRDAIQLEFNQLNDELNQIADTDYNGVVVLNGGQMADGTVAKDGKFDYSLGYTTEVIANNATDVSGKQADTIADQSFYDKKTADAVFDALGVDAAQNKEVKVTFMYDGTRWNAKTVTDKDGKVIEGARAAGLEARTVERDNASGLGGFEVIAGKDPQTGKDIVATNAIFDELKSGKDGGPVQMGDTITISFTNTPEKTYAPKNVGLDEDFDTTDKDAFAITNTAAAPAYQITEDNLMGKVKVTLNAGITDDAMNASMKTALDNLANAKFTATYAAGELDTLEDDNGKISAADNGDGTWTLTDDDSGLELATITMPKIEGSKPATAGSAAAATATYSKQLAGGAIDTANTVIDVDEVANLAADDTVDEDIVLTYDGTDWKTAGGTTVNLGTLGIATTGTTANTDEITLKYKAPVAATAATTGVMTDAEGTVKFGINVDAYNVADLSKIAVHGVATPDAATMKAEVAEQQKNGVSQSNAFNQAAAPLTYTDHIVLQSGARSKDAVDFTFKYSCGGMGNLKANMNCSAREDGLNTASLSLKTAKDANYAIDRIDNAINKVSMVRATFGAAQNRLEHKIDNMNVTKENLTSAESRIRDTNIAEEMSNFTRNQILSQAAQSMLAQANSLPQGALQLLG